MFQLPRNAKQPTIYFIGVTTGQSSIMKLFPIWADALGISARIQGIDLPVHAPIEDYRAVVSFIKKDPLSLGALVTTHKIDLYHAASDLFDYIDPYANMFGELSCISKQKGILCAHAKDPISCSLAMNSFIETGYFSRRASQVCILGAGGAAFDMPPLYS